MPLEKGSSKAVIVHNIKKLLGEGYPRRQAVAIAYEQAGRSKKSPRRV